MIESQQILVSKMLCPDGKVLHSKYRHDYVDHTDANRFYYFLDGGNSYIRHSGNAELLTIYENDPHSKIRDHFCWGSRGKLGDEPLHYIILKDMEDGHINAILETQHHIQEYIRKVFEDELHVRRVYKEFV